MGMIVVTGAASGIGAATRARLERDGRRTLGVDRNAADIVADLGTPEGRRTAVDKIAAAANGVIDGVVVVFAPGETKHHPKIHKHKIHTNTFKIYIYICIYIQKYT